MRPLSILLLYALSPHNRTLSYQRGWPREFARHPRFRVTGVDTRGNALAVAARLRWLALTGSFDAVVLLHSIYSNGLNLSGWAFDAVKAVKAPKAFFIGNEYKLLPEKTAFAERLGAALLVSQSEDARVHEIYRKRLGCAVAGLPNTGLDPELFFPMTTRRERPIDVGYRGFGSPLYLGHDEKREIAERFRAAAARHGLTADISTAADDRFTEEGWAEFLNRCQGQLGTEAGGDWFEIDDATRNKYRAWIKERPTRPTLAEVKERLFQDKAPGVPMRIVSGRQIEAAGTRTTQILLRGEYSGYFAPDVHYIPLDKDYGNADEAIAKLKDAALADRLADAAYAVALEKLTYAKLLDRFADMLQPLT